MELPALDLRPCGPCPTGEDCDASGACVCLNGLACNGQGGSPINSVPGSACGQCICPTGTVYNSGTNTCAACAAVNGNCTTTSSDGTSCSVITCPTNMNCNVTTNQCQCNAGTLFNGCVSCPPCFTSTDGLSCTPIQCMPHSTCDPTQPSDQLCQCWTGYHWDDTTSTCAKGTTGTCTPTTACPTGPNACAVRIVVKNVCGGNGGNCPDGLTTCGCTGDVL